MAKKPLLNITAISGTIGSIAIGIFFYIFNNSVTASVSSPMGLQPYFSYSTSDIQSLNSGASDKISAESEIDHMDSYFPVNQTHWDKTANEMSQSRLWDGVHFPIDEYDGLELGRKIGDWVVSKIKDR